MKRATRRIRKDKAPAFPSLVPVGTLGLAWRFTPGQIPGLQNIFPVVCAV